MNTLKISELIKVLQIAKKHLGDKPVVMSADCEGNSYSTITGNACSFCVSHGLFIIYPFNEACDLDEINGYTKEQ